MNSIPILTKQQKRAVELEVKKDWLESNKKYSKDFDKMYLYCLRRTQGWGAKRLKEFYMDFLDLFTQIQNDYLFNEEDCVWYVDEELKKLGLDVYALQKEWEDKNDPNRNISKD